jgi:hypothetical protein
MALAIAVRPVCGKEESSVNVCCSYKKNKKLYLLEWL